MVIAQPGLLETQYREALIEYATSLEVEDPEMSRTLFQVAQDPNDAFVLCVAGHIRDSLLAFYNQHAATPLTEQSKVPRN